MFTFVQVFLKCFSLNSLSVRVPHNISKRASDRMPAPGSSARPLLGVLPSVSQIFLQKGPYAENFRRKTSKTFQFDSDAQGMSKISGPRIGFIEPLPVARIGFIELSYKKGLMRKIVAVKRRRNFSLIVMSKGCQQFAV